MDRVVRAPFKTAAQKENLIAPCITRALREAVAWPKLAFTCSPAGLNWAFVLSVDQFTWLKTL